MPNPANALSPAPEEFRELPGTLSAHPARRDALAIRLQRLAELLADAGPLPPEPLLVWREPDRTVQHRLIGAELVVGRKAGDCGLALPNDRALSRRHFLIHRVGVEYRIQDLNSHNGTAVNDPNTRIRERSLCDGDLILTGNHAFAFLGQRETD